MIPVCFLEFQLSLRSSPENASQTFASKVLGWALAAVVIQVTAAFTQCLISVKVGSDPEGLEKY